MFRCSFRTPTGARLQQLPQDEKVFTSGTLWERWIGSLCPRSTFRTRYHTVDFEVCDVRASSRIVEAEVTTGEISKISHLVSPVTNGRQQAVEPSGEVFNQSNVVHSDWWLAIIPTTVVFERNETISPPVSLFRVILGRRPCTHWWMQEVCCHREKFSHPLSSAALIDWCPHWLTVAICLFKSHCDNDGSNILNSIIQS